MRVGSRRRLIAILASDEAFQEMQAMTNPDGQHANVRMEHDSLGDVEVTAEALWGAQTQRARENFPISGMHAHPAMIRATMLVKKAAALANMETGRLDERI